MLNPVQRIRESFSAKISALVFASVVATSLVVGLVTTNTTRLFLSERTSEQFPSTLTSTYSKIRTWYQRQVRDLEALCESEVFHDNLMRYNQLSKRDGSTKEVCGELGKYLDLVHDKFPIYQDILLLARSGDVIVATSDQAREQASSVFQMVRDNPEPSSFSQAQHDEESGRIYQWLVVPVKEANKPAAWIAARVDLVQLTGILDDVPLGAGGDLYMLDSQGRILTQPRREAQPLLYEHAMQVPTRQEGPLVVEVRSNYAGERVFHSKVQLENLNWWLVYEEDYDLAMAPVLSAQRRIWVAVLLIGILAVLASLRIAQSILRPIRSLSLGARRINEGLVGVKIPKAADDEIGMLTETFNEMAKTITLSKAELQYKNKMMSVQNDQLQQMNQRLEQLSVTDGLTGLYNHRHFWNILDRELARVDRYNGELALILVDLDDFKRVNDQFGHSVGDMLLQQISAILKETVRDTDVVARYGGEEFAILLPETDRPGVKSVAEKLRASVEALRFAVPDTDITLRVTVSVGISVFRGNRRDFFNAADKALYRSKTAGKNRVHFAAAA